MLVLLLGTVSAILAIVPVNRKSLLEIKWPSGVRHLSSFNKQENETS